MFTYFLIIYTIQSYLIDYHDVNAKQKKMFLIDKKQQKMFQTEISTVYFIKLLSWSYQCFLSNSNTLSNDDTFIVFGDHINEIPLFCF